MRINVNAFIAVVLCTALLGGLWLLNTRTVLDDGVWNPHDIYNSVGGSEYVSSNGSSEQSASSGTALSLSPSRTLSRKASSVPYHLMASSPYSPIASSPYGPITSSPISYASSAAQFHSFGGGGDMMGGVAGGSFRANPEAVPLAASLSMPSMPSPSYAIAQGSSIWQPEQTTQAASAIVAAASLYVPENSLFASMRGPIFQVGANSLSQQAIDAGYSVNTNKKATGIGGMFDDWLQGLVGSGLGVWNDEDGLYYFVNSDLEAAYLEAIANGHLPVGATWEHFVAWFYGQSDKYAFVPIPDGICFMCFLVLLYVVSILRKRKIVKTI